MDLKRQVNQRKKRARDLLDRRVDSWIETGRQFVDGVAGTRPGSRRSVSRNKGFPSDNFEKVGRWVGDKIDWFLEDEDGWMEPWETESYSPPVQKEFMDSDQKRPLEAISRRPKQHQISPNPKNSSQEILIKDEWPDESDFRVNRWQRKQVEQTEKFDERQSRKSGARPLPRSSRRRG